MNTRNKSDIQKSVTCIQKHKEGISQHGEQDLEFTNAEVTLYERRFQEGYDLHHDERYNEWIRRFHPSSGSPRPPFSTLDSSLRKLDDAHDDDDWLRIAQTSLPLDSVDASDVHCLTKASLVDKLVQNRKEQFKLPSLKVKKSSSILTSQENLKLLREKEMKKKKEEEEKAKRLALRQERQEKKKKEEEEKVKRLAL